MALNFDIPDDLVESVEEAVNLAEHLEPTDQASIRLALDFAEVIQDALESGDADAARKMTYGPMASLQKLLGDLGLTPEGRHRLELDVGEEEELEEY